MEEYCMPTTGTLSPEYLFSAGLPERFLFKAVFPHTTALLASSAS
tara:strand:- start:789 stop:923 length:135 start_codon:yes stop_codon:yes gene_type:complete